MRKRYKSKELPWHWRIETRSGITLEENTYKIMERRNGFVYFSNRRLVEEKYIAKRFLRPAIEKIKIKAENDLFLVIAEYEIRAMEVIRHETQ